MSERQQSQTGGGGGSGGGSSTQGNAKSTHRGSASNITGYARRELQNLIKTESQKQINKHQRPSFDGDVISFLELRSSGSWYDGLDAGFLRWPDTSSCITAESGPTIRIHDHLIVEGEISASGSLLIEDGSVGIGTPSPDSLLHLKSTGDILLKIEADSDNADESHQPAIEMSQDGGAVLGRVGFYSSSNNMSMGNAYSAGGLQLHAGGTTTRIYIAPDGKVQIGSGTPSTLLDVNDDSIRVRTSKTPSSASDTGTQGQIAWDSSYIYVCTATNTWKRSAIATW